MSPPTLFYSDTPVILKKDITDLTDYLYALEQMETWRHAIIENNGPEYLWLLEHRALITAGLRANKSDLLKPHALPLYNIRRGGQYTYHGPGQRIAYLVLNLKQRHADVKDFIQILQQWIIHTLHHLGIKAFTIADHIGVWVNTRNKKKETVPSKIAAIGIHLRRWVSIHGIAINIHPNLEDFHTIIPCGIKDYGVTSLEECGVKVTMKQFDEFLCQEFNRFFGPLMTHHTQ